MVYRLTREHTKDIYNILAASFSTPWSEDTIKALLQSDTGACYGVFDEDNLVGYAALEWVLDEGSLTDIAVLPAYRGKGIATQLMAVIVGESYHKFELRFITLEVRESNTPAISLYKKFGFEPIGKRSKYYKDPVEDALLMTKILK